MAEEKEVLDQVEKKVDEQGNEIVETPVEKPAVKEVELPVEASYKTPPVETSAADKEIEDSVLFAAMSKRLGRPVTSLEDMTVEKVVDKPLEYASEQVASIDKFIKDTGWTVNDWYETQQRDYNTVKSERLIKDKILRENPNLSDRQVDIFFESEYHIDSDVYDETEVTLAEVKLEMEGNKLRKELIGIQNKYQMPAEKEVTKPADARVDAPKPSGQDDNQASEFKKRWVEKRNEQVKALENIKVGQFDVAVDESIKESITKANSNLETFFPDHFIKDGKWQSERLNTFMYLAQEGVLEKVLGNVASTLIGEGKESVIKERKNLDMGGIPAARGTELSPEQQAELDAFKQAMVTSLS